MRDVARTSVQFARRKADELETTQILKGGGPARKRVCLEEKGGGQEEGGGERMELEEVGKEGEGEKEVEEFLATVSSLPLGAMGEEEARAKLSQLVADLLAKGSPYVTALMDSS